MHYLFIGIKIIVITPLVVLFSWILIHFLALFGIFLAISFPLFWLIAPKQMVCLLCRAQKEGASCSLCRRRISKKEGGTSPSTLVSAVLNGGIILTFSLISIGIVFGESQVLGRLGFPPAPKTASFTIPSKGQYRIGEIFPMKIEIDDMEKPVNAVQADVGFDPEKIEVVDVSTKNSFANIFIQKEIDNTGGWARLTGGVPNPGFSGGHGLFGTIYFKAKSPGLVKIGFLSSSMVLANDKQGTDILKTLPSFSYLILPEKISEEEEAEQQIFTESPNVLGVSTESGQLKFYDEGSVLGTEAKNNVSVKKKFDPLRSFLSLVEKVDNFILSLWRKR